jgi:hypothetical protein
MVGDFDTQEVHPIIPHYNEKNFFNIRAFDSESRPYGSDFYLHPLLIDGENVLSSMNLREPAANFNKKIRHLFDEPEAECFFSLRQPESDLNLRSNIFQRMPFEN